MKIVVAALEAWKHPRSIKIAKSLRKMGYDVEIWSAPTIKSKNRYLRALLKYPLAMISLALRKADIFWVENVPDVLYLPLILLRKRYIYDRRSPWALQIFFEFKNKFFYKVASLIERFSMAKSQIIVCVSQGLAEDATRFSKPIYVIPNYAEKNLRKKATKNLRSTLKIPTTTKIVLFVGKLSINEGANLLPQIADAFNSEKAELWIVGDGPARKFVKKILKRHPNNIRWFGWVPHHEVPNYIWSADLGIVPRNPLPKSFRKYYSHEGIQKISEYFLFKKPVLASEIKNSPFYLVVPANKLKDTIIDYLKDKIKIPLPPTNLTWQEVCELQLEKVLNYLKQKSN